GGGIRRGPAAWLARGRGRRRKRRRARGVRDEHRLRPGRARGDHGLHGQRPPAISRPCPRDAGGPADGAAVTLNRLTTFANLPPPPPRGSRGGPPVGAADPSGRSALSHPPPDGRAPRLQPRPAPE